MARAKSDSYDRLHIPEPTPVVVYLCIVNKPLCTCYSTACTTAACSGLREVHRSRKREQSSSHWLSHIRTVTHVKY